MRSRIADGRGVLAAAALAACVGVAGSAAAGGAIYSWRTEDGGWAFTDDEKAIPTMYRDQVDVRSSRSIDSYAQYTPADDQATARYGSRLAARLTYLRALNAQLYAPASSGQGPAITSSMPREQVTLRTRDGGGSSVDVSLPAESGGEPIVVETRLMRQKGSAVVQPVRVTRQGSRIVAVDMPRRRDWNINDFEDEEDLYPQ